jgi:hypothetical protein
MPDQIQAEPVTTSPPKPGEFCHPHFSWLCQAGRGKCQRGEQHAEPVAEEGR